MPEYFSQEAANPVKIPSTQVGGVRKDGYLTKRGKNFGGWKARYFVLDGPTLKYFEAPGGAILGSIKLSNAQIGKQAQHAPRHDDDDSEADYRHAFLILEPKRKDSSNHMPMCFAPKATKNVMPGSRLYCIMLIKSLLP